MKMRFGEELKDAIIEAVEEAKKEGKAGSPVIVDKVPYLIGYDDNPANETYGKRYAYEFTDRRLEPEEYIWLD